MVFFVLDLILYLTCCILKVDLHQPINLEVTLENFPFCRSLVIPPETTDYSTKIYLQDVEKRILELTVVVKPGVGYSQRVCIYSAAVHLSFAGFTSAFVTVHYDAMCHSRFFLYHFVRVEFSRQERVKMGHVVCTWVGEVLQNLMNGDELNDRLTVTM